MLMGTMPNLFSIHLLFNNLSGFTPVIDETTGQITGYKTSVGADTVFPFKSSGDSCVYYFANSVGNFNAQIQYATKNSNFFIPENNKKFIDIIKDCTVLGALYHRGDIVNLYLNSTAKIKGITGTLVKSTFSAKAGDRIYVQHTESGGTAYRQVSCFLILSGTNVNV